MIRVCCAFGTWQLVTLVASLQQAAHNQRKRGANGEDYQDYLVMYETGGVPDTFKETLQRMAEAVWPWKRIVWAYDLLTAQARYTQHEFARLRRKLRERLGVAADAVDEIWTCWINRPTEKIVFETFPRAKIVLYEDGLISYIPIAVAHRMKPPSELPFPQSLVGFLLNGAEAVYPALRLRRSHAKLDPRHLARVSVSYQLLTPDAKAPDALAAVPRQIVSYDLVRDVLARAASTVPQNAEEVRQTFGSRDCCLLILGQALSRNGIMSRDEEQAIYQNVVTNALDKGYRVLWKEHPRISEPFFDGLKERAESLGPEAEARLEQIALPNAFPVELVAERLHLAGCVAGTSAAVFYLKRLYAIPCYTFADQLLPFMQGVDVFMNDMVRGEALPFSTLPVAPTAKIEPNAGNV